MLRVVEDRGFMEFHESQVLHGLMNYASGFFSGRALKSGLRANLAAGTPWRSRFFEDGPRLLCPSPWGLESSVWSGANLALGLWSGAPYRVPTKFLGAKSLKESLARWTKMVGNQLICEIELYALLLIRARYRKLFLHRRVICFVDNDPTRLALIKGSAEPGHERDGRSLLEVGAREPFLHLDRESPELQQSCRCTIQGLPSRDC